METKTTLFEHDFCFELKNTEEHEPHFVNIVFVATGHANGNRSHALLTLLPVRLCISRNEQKPCFVIMTSVAIDHTTGSRSDDVLTWLLLKIHN